MINNKALPAISILLLLCVFLWAEEEGRNACIFMISDISSSEDYSEYQDIITDLLTVELKAAGYSIIPSRVWVDAMQSSKLKRKDLIQGKNALPLASGLEADLAVTGFYRVENERILLDIKCYNVTQKAFITGIYQSIRLNLSVFNLISEAVAGMIPQIHFIPEDVLLKDVKSVKEVILFSSDTDAAVYLPGDQFIGRIKSGELKLPEIPFGIGSTIDLEIRKQGYHTEWESTRITEERQEIHLKPLMKKTRMATEFTLGQIPGFGVGMRFYIKPDSMFVNAEYYFHTQYDLFNFKENRPVFHHDIKTHFGTYIFFKPASSVRVGISTGLGVVLTHFSVKGSLFYTDFYLNFINGWLEWNLKDWSVFIRSEAKYGLGIGKNLLGRGMWDYKSQVDAHLPPLTIGLVRKW